VADWPEPRLWSDYHTATHAETYEKLGRFARPLIRQHYNADSCIAATLIVCGALEVLGIRAEPFNANLVACNARWMQLMGERGGWPADEATMLDWTRNLGAWNVGIGLSYPHEVKPGQWNGHLVALTEDRVLIDASADQASRPERGLVLPGTILARHTRGFKTGGMRVVVPLEQDALAFYTPERNKALPTNAPDWKRTDRLAPLVLELVELIRGTRKPSTHLADGILRP